MNHSATSSESVNPKTQNVIHKAAVLLIGFLMLAISAESIAESKKPAKPRWLSPSNVVSDNGKARLEWKVGAGEVAEFFILKKQFQDNTTIGYVTGRELNIFRGVPGEYTFSIGACVKGDDGFPQCGAYSKKLKVTVTEAINDPYIEAGNNVELPDNPPSQSRVSGGPSKLRPGSWYSPSKPGHGWSFYWANRLALSSSPQNSYDLYGVWYTYEAKTKIITPKCVEPEAPCGNFIRMYNYRPVVVTVKLIEATSNTFVGEAYVTRNGTVIDEGSITVTFSDSINASVNWNVDFKHETLSGQDDITLLLGEGSNPFSNPTDLAGLWHPSSGSSNYFLVDDIGSAAEAIESIFYDNNGDPAWIQAVSTQAPTENSTSFCFYYVNGGFSPRVSGSLESSWFTSSGCDRNTSASSSNRNARRYFTDYETGRYWIDFQLPSVTLPAGITSNNYPASGALSIGTSTFPAAFTKQANFHRIYANNGNSCQISAGASSCNAVLTWFTDGAYPAASAYAYNQATGARTLIGTSTVPAMENQTASLAAGNYVFELRQSNSTGSRLIAESTTFEAQAFAGLAVPSGLNVIWLDQPNGQYRVGWSHANTAAVNYYKLEEQYPSSSVTVHTISPGSVRQKNLTRSPGSYRYRVKACSTSSGSELCSGYTAWFSWEVMGSAASEHPWADNEYGTLAVNRGWAYAMGYHFKPTVNGNITELGGFVNGTKIVKLFRRGGPELASASVTANNNWGYASIAPIAVTAGLEYTVAVYLVGSGGSTRTGVQLPKTYDSVEILGSTYISTNANPNAIPNNVVSTTRMYGQADIGFNVGAASVPPTITAVVDQHNAEGDSPSLLVVATDSDGTIVSFSDSNSLPPGLSISNNGSISGTITTGAVLSSPYNVTITVTDNDGGTAQEAFWWTIDPAPIESKIIEFQYDARGRLTGMKKSDQEVTTFTLDKAGNRVSVDKDQ